MLFNIFLPFYYVLAFIQCIMAGFPRKRRQRLCFSRKEGRLEQYRQAICPCIYSRLILAYVALGEVPEH